MLENRVADPGPGVLIESGSELRKRSDSYFEKVSDHDPV